MAYIDDGMARPASDSSPKGRNGNGQFARGNGGGPGRPRGYRSELALIFDHADPEVLTRIQDKAFELALSGNMDAIKLVHQRYAPAPKSRLVNFDLPAIEGAGDIPRAMGAVIKAAAAGELTLDEAAQINGMLAQLGRAYELAAIEKRVMSLEEEALVAA